MAVSIAAVPNCAGDKYWYRDRESTVFSALWATVVRARWRGCPTVPAHQQQSYSGGNANVQQKGRKKRTAITITKLDWEPSSGGGGDWAAAAHCTNTLPAEGRRQLTAAAATLALTLSLSFCTKVISTVCCLVVVVSWGVLLLSLKPPEYTTTTTALSHLGLPVCLPKVCTHCLMFA